MTQIQKDRGGGWRGPVRQRTALEELAKVKQKKGQVSARNPKKDPIGGTKEGSLKKQEGDLVRQGKLDLSKQKRIG